MNGQTNKLLFLIWQLLWVISMICILWLL